MSAIEPKKLLEALAFLRKEGRPVDCFLFQESGDLWFQVTRNQVNAIRPTVIQSLEYLKHLTYVTHGRNYITWTYSEFDELSDVADDIVRYCKSFLDWEVSDNLTGSHEELE